MLHTDIPTETELRTLASTRSPHCVSIYLPTSPLRAEAEKSRIELRNLLSGAVDQLEEFGADRRDVGAVRDSIEGLIDNAYFWTYQASTLVMFVTPERLHTYRIPNRLGATAQVSDRFHLKPLLRALSFPQAAFVLALSQNDVRLIEATIEGVAEEVAVPDLPADASAVLATRGDKGSVRLIGDEGTKTLLGHYARHVDDAVRPILNGLHVPLVIAASEPLASIYRAGCRYDALAEETIRGNPETVSANELAAAVRPILDRLYAAEVADLGGRIEEAIGRGTGSADLSDLARAATYGAIKVLLVDIDRSISGVLDEETGALTVSETDDAVGYGVVDEIARRALLSGARVVAVRADEMPGGAAAAGIMRFPV